ncbi:MAG: DUF4412 domain-containing protein [Holophagae bacterium]
MRTTLIFATLASLAMPAYAGVVYDIDSSYGGTSQQTSIAVDGARMKLDVASGDVDRSGYMIFDGDRHEMTVVNPEDRSYFVIDEAQMKKLAETVNQAMASMEQALAAMPEAQRAQMEKMMKSRMPAGSEPREPSELKKTGASDTVNGYDCTIYEVWRSGVRERELCVTDWDNVAGGPDVAKVFAEMGDFMTEMLDSLPKIGGHTLGNEAFEHMKEIDGFPVRTREYGSDGVLDGQSELTSSTETAIDTAEFEPPAGFKKQDLMKGMK